MVILILIALLLWQSYEFRKMQNADRAYYEKQLAGQAEIMAQMAQRDGTSFDMSQFRFGVPPENLK